jgi:hypothetical protein
MIEKQCKKRKMEDDRKLEEKKKHSAYGTPKT